LSSRHLLCISVTYLCCHAALELTKAVTSFGPAREIRLLNLKLSCCSSECDADLNRLLFMLFYMRRPSKLSPNTLESVSSVAPVSVSEVIAMATVERAGREHRPNSMERAASHKVEQWLSCSSSTSRLAADSTLSPKVRPVFIGCT